MQLELRLQSPFRGSSAEGGGGGGGGRGRGRVRALLYYFVAGASGRLEISHFRFIMTQ